MNPFVLVTVPLGAVTTTFTRPEADESGVVNTIDVDDSTVKVAETPPRVRDVVPSKLVPVSLLPYPPALGPEVTCNDVIVGGVK